MATPPSAAAATQALAKAATAAPPKGETSQTARATTLHNYFQKKTSS